MANSNIKNLHLLSHDHHIFFFFFFFFLYIWERMILDFLKNTLMLQKSNTVTKKMLKKMIGFIWGRNNHQKWKTAFITKLCFLLKREHCWHPDWPVLSIARPIWLIARSRQSLKQLKMSCESYEKKGPKNFIRMYKTKNFTTWVLGSEEERCKFLCFSSEENCN